MESEAAKILVTGGRGFIGRHMVRRLAAKEKKVFSLDVVKLDAVSSNPNVIELVQDIRETKALIDLIKKNNITQIFDLASFTEVHLPSSAYQRNVDQSNSMVEVVGASPDVKYVFFSTQFVHRVPERMPQDDEDYAPAEAYGESKVKSELLIRKGLAPESWLVARPSYIWGPGLARFRDGLLGNLMKNRMLVPTGNRVKRYYGYVETVVDQAIGLGEQTFSQLPHKAYYVSDDAISIQDFCQAFIDAAGRGKFHKAPVALIRAIGEIGELARRAGLPAPINRMQSVELTTNFPIPVRRTIDLTQKTTDLAYAAHRTLEDAAHYKGAQNGET